MIKWIFFDLGWTLVDETQAHRARLEATCGQLARFGFTHSADELMQLCERASSDFAASPFLDMLARLNLSRDQMATIMNSARYMKGNEALYPGVPRLLASLSRRFRLGVIANQSQGTEDRLARWQIRDYFSLVFASAELGLEKPDPRIFAAAQAQTGCRPGEVVMVGDRLDNDIGPAKAQGWGTVRVLQGFARLQEPRCPAEVPDIVILEIGALLSNVEDAPASAGKLRRKSTAHCEKNNETTG